MREIKLKIDGQEDRRTVMGILADYGYKVKIETKKSSKIIGDEYFIVIEVKE